MYTAMLTGPQNMPKFSNRQLSLEEKKDIIGFVKYVTESKPQGGLGLGGFGPVSEGMVMWFVGVIAIVAGTIASALAVVAAKQFIKAGAKDERELVTA